MQPKNIARRALFGVVALVLVAGVLSRRADVVEDGPAAIVEEDEQLRDAVASPMPVVPPSVVAPSRVALWASPSLRRREMDNALLSSRRARGEAPVR